MSVCFVICFPQFSHFNFQYIANAYGFFSFSFFELIYKFHYYDSLLLDLIHKLEICLMIEFQKFKPKKQKYKKGLLMFAFFFSFIRNFKCVWFCSMCIRVHCQRCNKIIRRRKISTPKISMLSFDVDTSSKPSGREKL